MCVCVCVCVSLSLFFCSFVCLTYWLNGCKIPVYLFVCLFVCSARHRQLISNRSLTCCQPRRVTSGRCTVTQSMGLYCHVSNEVTASLRDWEGWKEAHVRHLIFTKARVQGGIFRYGRYGFCSETRNREIIGKTFCKYKIIIHV